MNDSSLAGAVLDGQWWSLWTCQFMHWDWRHLLLNVVAALPPLVVISGATRWRLLRWSLFAAPIISLSILATGFQGEYRGASGLVVGIWILSGFELLKKGDKLWGSLLLFLITAKLVIELAGLWPSTSEAYVTSDMAHYAGAMVALVSKCRMQNAECRIERTAFNSAFCLLNSAFTAWRTDRRFDTERAAYPGERFRPGTRPDGRRGTRDRPDEALSTTWICCFWHGPARTGRSRRSQTDGRGGSPPRESSRIEVS